MQEHDPGAGNRNFGICGLEWVVWAMDAAREHNEREDSARFRLDYAHFYMDELAEL